MRAVSDASEVAVYVASAAVSECTLIVALVSLVPERASAIIR